VLKTPSSVKGWIQRICQIPCIDDKDGYTYAYLPDGLQARANWVESLQYRVIGQGEWLTRFYS
jgi:hypothetical protein